MNQENISHPNIRNSQYCPLCGGIKSNDLVVCWPCYRYHDIRYGNVVIMGVIDQIEYDLEILHNA